MQDITRDFFETRIDIIGTYMKNNGLGTVITLRDMYDGFYVIFSDYSSFVQYHDNGLWTHDGQKYMYSQLLNKLCGISFPEAWKQEKQLIFSEIIKKMEIHNITGYEHNDNRVTVCDVGYFELTCGYIWKISTYILKDKLVRHNDLVADDKFFIDLKDQIKEAENRRIIAAEKEIECVKEAEREKERIVKEAEIMAKHIADVERIKQEAEKERIIKKAEKERVVKEAEMMVECITDMERIIADAKKAEIDVTNMERIVADVIEIERVMKDTNMAKIIDVIETAEMIVHQDSVNPEQRNARSENKSFRYAELPEPIGSQVIENSLMKCFVGGDRITVNQKDIADTFLTTKLKVQKLLIKSDQLLTKIYMHHPSF